MTPIQSLWIGPRLSTMEMLCISSFIKNGHEFHLYLYEDMPVPDGTIVKDGNDILPESEIFHYTEHAGASKGSVSAFSNLFRYELLFRRGGYWVDLDVVCLKHFDFPEPYVFGREHASMIGAAILKAPAGCELLRFLVEECRGKDLGRIEHAEIGPRLVGEGVAKFNLWEFVKDTGVFFPLHWQHYLHSIDPRHDVEHENSYAFHLWNEMWRRSGIDKDASYHPDCLYEKFKREFMPHSVSPVVADSPMNKVFGIGMSKTGTSTLRSCFETLGLLPTCGCRPDLKELVRGDRSMDPINHKFEYDPLEPVVDKDVLEIVFGVTDQYKSFQDTPWYILFSCLDKRYPRSKFILTLRKDSRTQAISDWWHNEAKGRCKGPPPDEFIKRQMRAYEAHNFAVRSYFRNRPDDLLVVCWEDGRSWVEICEFLGLPVPDAPFPHANMGLYRNDMEKA